MMQVEVLKSKIHRVTVTEARLDYIGSITIDEDLMDAANIIAGEHVYIVALVLVCLLPRQSFRRFP